MGILCGTCQTDHTFHLVKGPTSAVHDKGFQSMELFLLFSAVHPFLVQPIVMYSSPLYVHFQSFCWTRLSLRFIVTPKESQPAGRLAHLTCCSCTLHSLHPIIKKVVKLITHSSQLLAIFLSCPQ